uniref:Uncharacterized protein n=1 Tax=Timema cristinae TaxID=61476 RepID=A0A7R9H9N8_TIMCR|nr:unnamed protein product [Timema cristinae]
MLIDAQGYSSDEIVFIFKEVSVLHFEPFEEANYKFLPPFMIDNLSASSRRNVDWARSEKITWLQSVPATDSDKYNFCELGNLGCPTLSKLKNLYNVNKCSTHSGSVYSCATENVRLLNEWFRSDQARLLRSD